MSERGDSARNPSSRTGRRLWILCGLITMLGVLISGTMVVNQSKQRQLLYRQAIELREERDQQLAEYSRLTLERGSLSSYQRVQRIANEDLEMDFPDRVTPVEDSARVK